MSKETVLEKSKTQHIVRRRKMMIIEEEFLTEDIEEQPFEDIFREVIMHGEPVSEMCSTLVSSENLDKHAIDDLEERKELARIVGLENLPVKTSTAFDEISGIFDGLGTEKEVDTVKMVKKIRRRR